MIVSPIVRDFTVKQLQDYRANQQQNPAHEPRTLTDFMLLLHLASDIAGSFYKTGVIQRLLCSRSSIFG